MSRPAAAPDQASWHPEVLDQLRRELGDDDGTMIAEIVALYLTQTRKLLGQLTAAAATNDDAQVREIAHSLKGSSLAVGGTGLARICQGLELGAYSESPITIVTETVREEFHRLADSLCKPPFVSSSRTFSEPGLAAPSDEVLGSHGGNRA